MDIGGISFESQGYPATCTPALKSAHRIIHSTTLLKIHHFPGFQWPQAIVKYTKPLIDTATVTSYYNSIQFIENRQTQNRIDVFHFVKCTFSLKVDIINYFMSPVTKYNVKVCCRIW